MISINLLSGNIVVTRSLSQQQKPSPTYYEDDVLTSIYYIPKIPFINLPNLPSAQWILGVIEFLIISITILIGIVVFLAIKKTKSQYKCPNCGESFCFSNTIPENCKKCGHPINPSD